MACKAAETRMLSIKNTDNKIVCGTMNNSISKAAQRNISKYQRGFVRGRQLAHNIVDLDFAGRLYAGSPTSHLPSILVLWDFANAFPSVFHSWIFGVFRAWHFPIGFQNLLFGIFLDLLSYVVVGHDVDVFLWISAGILQGCPLAGFTFAVILDPF